VRQPTQQGDQDQRHQRERGVAEIGDPATFARNPPQKHYAKYCENDAEQRN
jgi:hypothetical protein